MIMKRNKKKIVFVTGTRADFGKIKSLINILNKDNFFEVYIFATGMHMQAKYGYTVGEIEKAKFKNIYKFMNNSGNDSLDTIMGNTISGFGNYVREINPDMIVVHGDRAETLAGALVGSFNNILVAHIEGGESSGTIDESIRHATSKISHVHFVANADSKKRLTQMGENQNNIYIIGSPDLDIMDSKFLPSIQEAKKRYEIDFDKFAIAIFHPVTTELDTLAEDANSFVDALLESPVNYILFYPNNDSGNETILGVYKRKIINQKRFRIFSSVRFEYFLTFLKNALFVVGNSSLGVREAPYYGVPSINIGSRQNNRFSKIHNKSIFNCNFQKEKILDLIQRFSVKKWRYPSAKFFGKGDSDRKFIKILKNNKIWETKIQKEFFDINF
jgi:UDP-N-acetylglucosamine 2-epimerase (hydrolysing)